MSQPESDFPHPVGVYSYKCPFKKVAGSSASASPSLGSGPEAPAGLWGGHLEGQTHPQWGSSRGLNHQVCGSLKVWLCRPTGSQGPISPWETYAGSWPSAGLRLWKASDGRRA